MSDERVITVNTSLKSSVEIKLVGGSLKACKLRKVWNGYREVALCYCG